MTLRHHRAAPLAIGFAALLAGCATGGSSSADKQERPVVAGVADLHRIVVSELTERLELPAGALDADSIAALEDFAALYRSTGRGPISIAYPVNAADDDAAQAAGREIRLRVAETGVPFKQAALSGYDASGVSDAPVLVTFARFEAGAPDCLPLFRQDLSNTTSNQPHSSFGCATQANLAAMVADPADLIGPRPEEPADAARRQVTLDKYRQGEPTHAARSGDERVSISTAVR